MKKTLLILLTITCLTTLTACGRTGALYLPENAHKPLT